MAPHPETLVAETLVAEGMQEFKVDNWFKHLGENGTRCIIHESVEWLLFT